MRRGITQHIRWFERQLADVDRDLGQRIESALKEGVGHAEPSPDRPVGCMCGLGSAPQRPLDRARASEGAHDGISLLSDSNKESICQEACRNQENEVGLFERLSEGPSTLDDLARRTEVPSRTLRIIADAMVALGLLERHGDDYQNGSCAATFLSGRTPADLRPFLRFWNHVSYPRWMKLEAAVRTDQIIFGEFTAEEQQLYSEGVQAVTSGTARALASSYDFNPHRRVRDLGGGTGSFLIPVLDHYPGLESTLYDLPAVAATTRRRLDGNPFARRIRIVEGDFFKNPIPDGHDAVIIANIVHCFSREPV